MALTPNSPNADNSMQALKQYGSYIVTAILLALAAYFGWTYWQNNHARVDTVAADQYADIQQLNEEVKLASQNPDLEAEAQEALTQSRSQLDKDIDTLVSTHGESVYAWQALMIKARQQVDNDDFAAATETFKKKHWPSIWVMLVWKRLLVYAMQKHYWLQVIQMLHFQKQTMICQARLKQVSRSC